MVEIPIIAHSRLQLAIFVLSVHSMCLAVSSRRSVRGWIRLDRLDLVAKSEVRQLRECIQREHTPHIHPRLHLTAHLLHPASGEPVTNLKPTPKGAGPHAASL